MWQDYFGLSLAPAMRCVWGVSWRCFSKVVSTSKAPKWWQQGWPRERAGSVAEAELLAPLGELLMPAMPVEEMFRSFKSPKGWSGNYLEPDLSAFGLLKKKPAAALFVEYDGYYLHGRKEGIERDHLKNAALLGFAPVGSYVVRINHRKKRELKEHVLWVSVNPWRRGDQNSLAKALISVVEQTLHALEHVLHSRVAESLLRQREREAILISRSACHFRDAAIYNGSGNTMEEINNFLSAEGFGQMDIQLMQGRGLVVGKSIERTLKPKLHWLVDLGLTKSQVAKAVTLHPRVLGLSIEQNLKPTVEWMLKVGLADSQLAKAVASHPAVLGYSIEQNLKPTVQWMLETGLTESQVAKTVATFPQILGLSIKQNLKPTVQWMLKVGLAKSEVAKAVAAYPRILGYSIEHNLKPTVQWMVELGLAKSQVAKAVAKSPSILGCSIQQNLKPTVEWMLELGLSRSQVAKAVATYPQILRCSIEQNLKPTVEWLLELGLTRSQVAKAVPKFPQILGLSVQKNLAYKVTLLQSFCTPADSVDLIVRWPVILGYSRPRLAKRLIVLSEQNRMEGLISAMSLTEEAFHRRFLSGSERCGECIRR